MNGLPLEKVGQGGQGAASTIQSTLLEARLSLLAIQKTLLEARLSLLTIQKTLLEARLSLLTIQKTLLEARLSLPAIQKTLLEARLPLPAIQTTASRAQRLVPEVRSAVRHVSSPAHCVPSAPLPVRRPRLVFPRARSVASLAPRHLVSPGGGRAGRGRRSQSAATHGDRAGRPAPRARGGGPAPGPDAPAIEARSERDRPATPGLLEHDQGAVRPGLGAAPASRAGAGGRQRARARELPPPHRAILEEGYPSDLPERVNAIIKGNMLNHLRGQRRCRESPGLPTSSKERPRSSQDLERAAIRRALRDRLLAVIGPELHDVVEAVFLHDLTHQEAATLLGLSDGSLKARVAKAKRELSEQASLILPPSQRSAS